MWNKLPGATYFESALHLSRDIGITIRLLVKIVAAGIIIVTENRRPLADR
jgi:hypothetical protein